MAKLLEVYKYQDVELTPSEFVRFKKLNISKQELEDNIFLVSRTLTLHKFLTDLGLKMRLGDVDYFNISEE